MRARAASQTPLIPDKLYLPLHSNIKAASIPSSLRRTSLPRRRPAICSFGFPIFAAKSSLPLSQSLTPSILLIAPNTIQFNPTEPLLSIVGKHYYFKRQLLTADMVGHPLPLPSSSSWCFLSLASSCSGAVQHIQTHHGHTRHLVPMSAFTTNDWFGLLWTGWLIMGCHLVGTLELSSTGYSLPTGMVHRPSPSPLVEIWAQLRYIIFFKDFLQPIVSDPDVRTLAVHFSETFLIPAFSQDLHVFSLSVRPPINITR